MGNDVIDLMAYPMIDGVRLSIFRDGALASIELNACLEIPTLVRYPWRV